MSIEWEKNVIEIIRQCEPRDPITTNQPKTCTLFLRQSKGWRDKNTAEFCRRITTHSVMWFNLSISFVRANLVRLLVSSYRKVCNIHASWLYCLYCWMLSVVGGVVWVLVQVITRAQRSVSYVKWYLFVRLHVDLHDMCVCTMGFEKRARSVVSSVSSASMNSGQKTSWTWFRFHWWKQSSVIRVFTKVWRTNRNVLGKS